MLLTVKVTPRARQNAIVSYDNGILKVRLHAVPEKGEANDELIEFLAETFDLPKSSIYLIRGHTSRIKHLELQGLSESELKKYCP
jgi:uncharacterized protein (TIGR00251 family)